MTLNKQVAMTPARNYIPEMEPPASVTERPSFGQVVKDAFALESTLVAAGDLVTEAIARDADSPVPDFDPFENIEDTIFEQFPESLVGVSTPDEKLRVETKLHEELEARERLASSGVLGFGAMFAAGVLDPLILVPIGGQIKAVRAGIAAARATKAARVGQIARVAVTGTTPAELVSPLTAGIVTARAAMLGSGAAEVVLQSAQDTRTFGEGVANVTASMFLGGVLGGTVGQISAKARQQAIKQINADLGRIAGGVGDADAVTLTAADLVKPSGGGKTGAEIKLANMFGAERFATAKGLKPFASPFVRVLVTETEVGKRAMLEMVDPPLRTEGIVTGSSVEAEILEKDGVLFEMLTSGDRLYSKYRTRLAKEAGGQPAFVQEGGRARNNMIRAADTLTRRTEGKNILSKKQFMEAVGRASRTKDSGIPEIDELGALWNDHVYGPMLDDAINLELLPEEVRELGPKGARNYLQRIYNQDKLIAHEPAFKRDKIKPWLRSVMTDEEIDAILKAAKAPAKKRTPKQAEEAEAPDAQPALTRRVLEFDKKQNDAINKAVDLQTQSIFENMTSATRGRIPYERVQPSKGSPFKERALTWTDDDIEEFIEQDIEILGERYIRTIAPDLALTRKFGSVTLDDQIAAMADEYAVLRGKATSDAERARLQKNQAEVKGQLLGAAALLRGTYAVPPHNPLVTAARGFRLANFMSMLGGVTLNSIPDIGMIPMRNGLLRSFSTGYAPLISNFNATKLSKAELQRFGAAVDLAVDTRSRVIADVGDDFAQNRTQQTMQNIGKNFSIANLLAPWNSLMKGIAGNVSMTRMIESIISEGAGTITAKEVKNLEFARLTPDIRKRILVQLKKDGGMTEQGTLKWSNTQNWDDIEARQEWGRSVRFTVDNTILTPGAGATPLWLSTELGRTIFQFQRFSFGATNTILMSGMQTRDMATFNGIAMMSALGMVVEWSKNELNDRPNPKDVSGWVTAGIDRTGLLGVYGTMYNVGARAMGKSALSSRFAARNLVSSLMGPTLGTAESVSRLVISGTKGEFSDSDMHILRRLLPYNQIPYVQWGFDQIEEGASRALNLPRKRKRKTRSN